MSAFTVREYTPSDRPAVETLSAELQDYERRLRPTRAQRVPAAYLNEFDAYYDPDDPEADGAVFLAQDQNGTAIGFIACDLVEDLLEQETPELLVRDLVVTHQWRGMGVGRALLKQAEDLAHHRGIRRLSVNVLSANEQARAVYAAWGFRSSVEVLERDLT